ncbi:T9SS type A sorting domain-containing protein [Xanthomarina sp. F1114]|uniref:T9SS type A sorting domain-containing protein n=1 Tax=Xanthomarina sp. F1114 TaxID=2996019 RepID=UPI00225E1DEA|nr:T9SS type A sorting domain-containing protein [Xanthomarina sp. F1114]MCX7548794.1 T9SS type A sorting domain-containing protein [Xanthomarina sp. F1114]
MKIQQLKSRQYIIFMAILSIVINSYSQPTLLKDINVGSASSMENAQFIKIGDRLLFSADDGIHGVESWLTDGTSSGTIRLADNTTTLIDTTYTPNGNGLFKTNGTGIEYVFANMGFTLVNRVTKVNDIWFFVANIDSQNKEELWKSDGTEAGTVLVKKFRPNSYDYAYTKNLIAASNGTDLYFTANDGTGMALWKSDGTTNGTTIIKYFVNTPQYEIGNFINFNNYTYFWAYSEDEFSSLWKTNGTEAGTVMVQEKIETNLAPGRILVYNNKIYFHGQRQVATTNYGWELWVSDGTSAGTRMFYDINPDVPDDVILGGNPSNFHIVNNLLLFKANTVLNGKELWVTNGTESGTFMLNDVYPGPNSGFLNGTPINGLNKLFFTGNDGNQRMLWETDGTTAGTVPLYDISESDLPMQTYSGYINDKLLFLKETVAHGKELWSFNPTLSVEDFDNGKKTHIYPNPVAHNLTIENPSTDSFNLKVLNQLGQMVLIQNQNTASTTVDVSTLSKGLYFIHITSENGNTETIKFIKK